MIEKHAFGNLVECGTCRQLVAAVWAASWEDARDGHGQCDECKLTSEQSADQPQESDAHGE